MQNTKQLSFRKMTYLAQGYTTIGQDSKPDVFDSRAHVPIYFTILPQKKNSE